MQIITTYTVNGFDHYSNVIIDSLIRGTMYIITYTLKTKCVENTKL